MVDTQSRGKKISMNVETWAVNIFDEWRRCNGISTAKLIVDFFEEDDLHVFVNMPFKFTL